MNHLDRGANHSKKICTLFGKTTLPLKKYNSGYRRNTGYCLLGNSGVVAGEPGGHGPLNRGANGERGAPRLFACNVFG